MEPNEELRERIFEIIENQLKANDPPETKVTFDRLRKQGFNDFQTRQLIGQCIGLEIFEIWQFGEPFNDERFIKNLESLPEAPFDY